MLFEGSALDCPLFNEIYYSHFNGFVNESYSKKKLR